MPMAAVSQLLLQALVHAAQLCILTLHQHLQQVSAGYHESLEIPVTTGWGTLKGISATDRVEG